MATQTTLPETAPAVTEPDDWPAVERPVADHVVTDTDRQFIIACATDNTRIVRNWRKVSETTIRRRDVYQMYSYPDEAWDTTQDHVRDYEIDADGAFVGDGSAWSGEGIAWKAHARDRHAVLLTKRFPMTELACRD